MATGTCRSLVLRHYVTEIIITVYVILFLVTDPAAASITSFYSTTPDRGFGSGMNKYAWSSSTFSKDNKVYIGTFNVNMNYLAVPEYVQQIANAPNPEAATLDAFRRLWSGSPMTPSSGGEIYSYDGTGWTLEYKATADHVGFRSMAEYDGSLYAFSARGAEGPNPGDTQYKGLPPAAPDNTVTYTGMQVLRSTDGTTWTEISGGPADNPYNASGRSATVIDGKLWVGTENPVTGPEIWSFDGSGWRLEKRLPNTNIAIGDMIEVNGKPYVGTWSVDDFQLLELGPESPDPLSQRTAANVTPLFSDPSIVAGNAGVMKLQEFKGRLALSTVNYSEGFTLLHTDDPSDATSWTVTTTTGFNDEYAAGNDTNAYGWDFEVLSDKVYMTTFEMGRENSPIDQMLGFDVPLDGRAQLWVTDDFLSSWEIVEDNGWDSMFTYGGRTMTTWNDRLVIGTASNMFVPDLFSDPYSQMTLDETMVFLRAQGYDSAADWLEALNLDENLPYIGAEVYMSNAVSAVPSPSALVLVAIGLVSLQTRHRRRHCQA